MRAWKTGGVLLLAILAASCGGSGTLPSVTVSPATALVILNGTQLFTATVTGSGSSTVNWQICLPPPKSGDQPVSCGTNTLGKLTTVAGSNSVTYTAPASVPQPSTFDVVAFSTSNDLYFGAAQVTVTSGVTVSVAPVSATVQELQSIIFTATVSGSTNTAVSWELNGNSVSGGNPQLGTLTPSSNNTAVYTAPGAVPSGQITVQATSVVDATSFGDANVSVTAPADPVITTLSPTIAPEGSAQQDVYINGTGFETNDTVYAGTGVTRAPVTTFFISTALLRATVPSQFFQQSGTLQLQVQRTATIVSQPLSLTVEPVRPSLLTSTPMSTSTNAGAVNVSLTGGFYTPTTQAIFNGLDSSSGVIVNYSNNNSRQLTVTLPANSLGTAGLYPLFVQNLDAEQENVPSMASTNLAVEPPPQSIPTSQVANVTVGASPSAVAVDQALGLALVANEGDGSVSVINLTTNTVTRTIPNVATQPSSIAVDDMLSPNVAVVVDEAQNSVVAINLSTFAVSAPVTLPVSSPTPTPPIAIGINPLTHRAIVANQLTDIATILQVGVSNGSPTLTVEEQVGAGPAPYSISTGLSPTIAVDSRLNWAVIAPGGGGGVVSFVDLGDAANQADPIYPSGRNAQVVGTLSLGGSSPTGVAINPESHTAILADPNTPTVAVFNLLDNSYTTGTFRLAGTGYVATGASLTSNLGVVVNQNSNTAAIVDLSTGNVLQETVSVGNFPQAVAVDPATNKAVVANQGDGTASIVSLGPVRSLHITEAGPNMTLTSTNPIQVTLNGSGFISGTSEVLLDGAALPSADVNVVSSRQIVATIPASDLGAPRRYSMNVENPGGGINLQSNELDLTVIQPVTVGQGPVGVAVDSDHDIAVVSNYSDGTASLVDLNHGITLAPSPITVGTNPQGVAVLPRLSMAIVADTGSNQATLIDETGVVQPQFVDTCASGACFQPWGVGVNGDTGIAVIANFQAANPTPANLNPSYYYSFVTMSLTSPSSTVGGIALDNGPEAVAFDPNLNYVAITTTEGTSLKPGNLDLIDFETNTSLQGVPNFTNPTGIVFDPLNQQFLVADREANDVVVVNPTTLVTNTIATGIDPTSLAYDYQTSTLVTANNESNSLSLIDFACVTGCGTASEVRRVIPLAGSQQFSVGIDSKLNLLVLADQQNNRVLLVPLP
ncbi:MAG TPA: hypothetical protein VMJ93_06215 [Verrucomicrobiae bacterium]|nr:hypothetical protein [Verrucomicrobiae bacterium]